jgi:hypothetical protein
LAWRRESGDGAPMLDLIKPILAFLVYFGRERRWKQKFWFCGSRS